jgi:hypothetical protein
MPRINTEELFTRIRAGNYKFVLLRGMQDGTFYLVLECEDGSFVLLNQNEQQMEFPKVDNALVWLKRMTDLEEFVVNISLMPKNPNRK